MTSDTTENTQSELPASFAAPARRALAAAGYTRLTQLSEVSEVELLKLHGMGPKALEQLRHALAAKGQDFRFNYFFTFFRLTILCKSSLFCCSICGRINETYICKGSGHNAYQRTIY